MDADDGFCLLRFFGFLVFREREERWGREVDLEGERWWVRAEKTKDLRQHLSVLMVKMKRRGEDVISYMWQANSAQKS